MWVDLDNVRQSEVSKKKPKHGLLTHICGIWGNSVDGPIYNTETGTEVQNKFMAANRGRGRGMNWEGGLTCMHYRCCV